MTSTNRWHIALLLSIFFSGFGTANLILDLDSSASPKQIFLDILGIVSWAVIAFFSTWLATRVDNAQEAREGRLVAYNWE
jgi:ABC-type enterochelin transport system permease subunit